MYEQEIRENQVLLCTTSAEDYLTRRIDILNGLTSNNKNICYISFTKPYTSIKQELSTAGFSDVFFIDTLTMSVQKPPEADDCLFVQAPTALIDISVAISKVIEKKGSVSLLFDSLSSLLVYQDSLTLIKFLHNIINKSRVQNVKLVFLVLKKDVDSELVKDLYMFVDKVVE